MLAPQLRLDVSELLASLHPLLLALELLLDLRCLRGDVDVLRSEGLELTFQGSSLGLATVSVPVVQERSANLRSDSQRSRLVVVSLKGAEESEAKSLI